MKAAALNAREHLHGQHKQLDCADHDIAMVEPILLQGEIRSHVHPFRPWGKSLGPLRLFWASAPRPILCVSLCAAGFPCGNPSSGGRASSVHLPFQLGNGTDHQQHLDDPLEAAALRSRRRCDRQPDGNGSQAQRDNSIQLVA
jgi:hypothetical protein